MRKSKKYSARRKIVLNKKEFLIPKNKLGNWKMLATRLEHRRVEGKRGR